jgi:hypothetical protein
VIKGTVLLYYTPSFASKLHVQNINNPAVKSCKVSTDYMIIISDLNMFAFVKFGIAGHNKDL